MKLQLPAHMKSYRDLVDGSANITFSTPELTDEEILILRRFRNDTGWLLFAPNSIQEHEIPQEMAEVSAKSNSTRLRAILYVYWKQQREKGKLDKYNTFNQYYDAVTESYIDRIKEKLDE